MLRQMQKPYVKNQIRHLVGMSAFMLLSVATGQAHAARILVLTTSETAGDAVQMTSNCITEFMNQSATHTVTALAGKLNDNASPLTAADLSPAAGPYDIVATCTVYNSANAQAISVISSGMQNRAARAFFHFDEKQSFGPAFQAAKSNWTLTESAFGGGNAEPQVLNTRSIYSAAFTGLNPLGGHFYGAFSGAPINNTLYTPQNHPVGANDVTAGSASTLVVPTVESYLDASGKAQGACLFSSRDVSMFDSVRYTAAGTAGKIAPAFLRAIEPGGACSPAPSIEKAFDQGTVALGGTANLTITVRNNSGYTDSQGAAQPAAPVTGLNVQDQLPSPLQLAGTPQSTCTGGTLTGSAGSTSLALSGATLPAAGCTIRVAVAWPASSAGRTACTGAGQPVTNTINPGTDFTTSAGQSPAAATATLACDPAAVLPSTVDKRPVPGLQPWSLAALAALFLFAAAGVRRKQG